jgi:hypothetical protein
LGPRVAQLNRRDGERRKETRTKVEGRDEEEKLDFMSRGWGPASFG